MTRGASTFPRRIIPNLSLTRSARCSPAKGIFWDFRSNGVSETLLDYFGFNRSLIPEVVPTFAEQGRLSADAAQELGLVHGIPVAYRSGDQPNNAFSLNVLHPGDIAATAGTSGSFTAL